MPETETCKTCGGKITMIVQQGSGYCSQNCEDAASDDPTVNRAGVMPHRSVGSTPTEQRRTTTFKG